MTYGAISLESGLRVPAGASFRFRRNLEDCLFPAVFKGTFHFVLLPPSPGGPEGGPGLSFLLRNQDFGPHSEGVIFIFNLTFSTAGFSSVTRRNKVLRPGTCDRAFRGGGKGFYLLCRAVVHDPRCTVSIFNREPYRNIEI